MQVRTARRELAGARRAATEAAESAERAARSARRLALAVDVVPVGVMVADEGGVEVLRNSTAAGLLEGGPGGVLVGHALTTMMAEAGRGRSGAQTVDLLGPPPRTVVVRSQPLTEESDLLGAVGTMEDVTERRQLEATRRDFVANMSHELRTPVGALAALAEALADEPDPDVMRRLARRVVDEAERATRIIEDLLDLSRIETEGAESRPPVRVSALLARATERVESAAREQGTRLVLPSDDPLTVPGNEGQLVSALANLLDNAIKYSPAGSVVEVTVGHGDGEVQVAVRDEGIGIPAKDHERIFERFYRVDPARSRNTGGTGLGLAIVRHVAINHGGRVMVQSREGEGSTFVLVLPEVHP